MIFGPLAGRIINFYPRSPRGERPPSHSSTAFQLLISIHAPREGSDVAISTSPYNTDISIHAPREGSDTLI